MYGTEFYNLILPLSTSQRERKLFDLCSEIPPWCRPNTPVTFRGKDVKGAPHDVVLRVALDYVGFGVASDFFRMPMLPKTARKIADALGAVLPTREIAERIYAFGKTVRGVAIPPCTVSRSFWREHKIPMTTLAAFKVHNDRLELNTPAKAKARDILLVGHKKDIVVSPALESSAHKDNMAIFGWYEKDKPIQGLNYFHHTNRYVDYSHGVRLVGSACTVDGVERTIVGVMNDSVLHPLLSDEGRLDYAMMYQ